MKFKFWLYTILLSLLLSPSFLSAQQTGMPVLFNADWDFHRGNIPAGINGIADIKDWRKLELPHDWSIEGPFSEAWASATGYLPGGTGWYKKTFNTEPNWKEKKVAVYFDGVYKNSEVWINGHFLGKRPNGFIPFSYDLSPYLHLNGQNTIIVKVDHSEFADSRWYTGSGIYRNVYLVVKNPIHMDMWDVAFSTPVVTRDAASVKVNVKVNNSSKKTRSVTVEVKMRVDQQKQDRSLGIMTPADLLVQKQILVRPGVASVAFEQQLNHPLLWDTDTPHLYQLEVSILEKGVVLDVWQQPVGIRKIRFDRNLGFFLNGKNRKLKGVCLHDDAGALGVAVPKAVWIRRLKILKEAGVNAIRMSHNPHADYLYDLCDQMGFMVMDEAFDEWEIGKNKWVSGWNTGTPVKNGYHEYFDKWADTDIKSMVQRARNHPSIILWSIGNEVDYPNDPYTDEVLNTGRNPQIYGKGFLPDHPQAKEIVPIARRLVNDIKSVDTTRPVTAALAGVVMSNEVGYPDVLDVVGYNYQEYRYPEDHAKYPDRIIYGSENGMQPLAWEAVESNQYISGQFLWTGIDYLGEAGKWPQRSSGAGLLDLAGFKKPGYYYRQSLWADKPMTYLVTQTITTDSGQGHYRRHMSEPVWNWPAATKVKVLCYSNCQEVELFLNGRSLGRLSSHDDKGKAIAPSWDVDYQAGVLSVVGYNNGTAVSHNELHTAGAPYALKVIQDSSLGTEEEGGLNQLEVQVVDKEGNLVYMADNEVRVLIKGRAKLLGLESGSSSSHESYQSDRRKVLHGRLLAYIQSTGFGKIQVEFRAEGVRSMAIELDGH